MKYPRKPGPSARHSRPGRTAALLLVLALSWAAASATNARAGEAEPDSVAGTVRIAFTRSMFSSVNVEDAEAAIQAWIETMVRADGQPIRTYTRVLAGVPELRAALLAGEFEGSVTTVAEFLQIEDDVDLSPLLPPDAEPDDEPAVAADSGSAATSGNEP